MYRFPVFQRDLSYPPEVVDFSSLTDYSAIKLFFTHESHDVLVALKDKILETHSDVLSHAFSLPFCLEFMDKSVDKSVAIERILNNDGLIAFASEAFSKDKEQLFADLELVGTKFWIAMPFKFGHNTSILASKKYHPTADINLQRSDLLDGLDYYSSEIQLASFVFPAAEHRALTGIAKR